MSTPAELEVKFWKALKSDRTVMLGIVGADEGHTRPMTAQLNGDEGPIWFFGAKDSALAQALGGASPSAVMAFAAKNHDLFASVHGTLSAETDRTLVDRLRIRSSLRGTPAKTTRSCC